VCECLHLACSRRTMCCLWRAMRASSSRARGLRNAALALAPPPSAAAAISSTSACRKSIGDWKHMKTLLLHVAIMTLAPPACATGLRRRRYLLHLRLWNVRWSVQ